MLVGPNILVFPALNPVLVAEEAATMDWLSGGRFVLGLGLGYRDEEYTAFGVSLRHRAARLEEGVGLMRRLWAGERVTHRGKHFTVEDAGLALRPKQQAGPPIWIAAVVEKAIERAATLGDEWLITFYPTVKTLGTQLARYREVRAAAGLPAAVDYPLCRECHVGASMAGALGRGPGPSRLQVRGLRLVGAGRHPGLRRPLRPALRRIPPRSLPHRRRGVGQGRDRALPGRSRGPALHHANAMAGARAEPGDREHRAPRSDRGLHSLTLPRNAADDEGSTGEVTAVGATGANGGPDVPMQPVSGAAVWTAAELKERGGWLHVLGPDEIAELSAAADAVEAAGVDLRALDPERFELPRFAAVLARLRRQIIDGIGFVQIRGSPSPASGGARRPPSSGESRATLATRSCRRTGAAISSTT